MNWSGSEIMYIAQGRHLNMYQQGEHLSITISVVKLQITTTFISGNNESHKLGQFVSTLLIH